MAAKDHLNPAQLKLFMAPDEVKSQFFPGDALSPKLGVWDQGDVDAMWRNKVDEAERPGIIGPSHADHIRQQGVKQPIVIGFDDKGEFSDMTDKTGLLLDGHHRVAAASEIQQERQSQPPSGVTLGGTWMPVQYVDSDVMDNYGQIIQNVRAANAPKKKTK